MPAPRRIGLIGGMSWESSALYYRLVNEGVRERLGGLHSADCVMVSVDFHDIEALQRSGDWSRAAEVLAAEAVGLAGAGAECLVLCTNTMHKVADEIEAAVNVPLIHIADVTARAVTGAGLRRVGLLGTRFTMEEPFLRQRLERHGIEVVLPEAPARGVVDRVVFEELVRGVVRDDSRDAYQDVMAALVERGAEGIVLGCTEIELLVRPYDVAMPTFATTALHAQAAVDFALGRLGA